jgi:transcriptional regulator with XRE-family HTH domain
MHLATWLETRGVHAPDFAKRIGVSPRYLHMLKIRRRRPGLALLRTIEKLTDGDVTIEDWFAVPLLGPKPKKIPSSRRAPRKPKLKRNAPKPRRSSTECTSA